MLLASLGPDSDDDLAEIVALEHADKGFRRLLQTVDDVFAIADPAFRDAGPDFAREFVIVLFRKLGVDESAQRQALLQDLALRRCCRSWSPWPGAEHQRQAVPLPLPQRWQAL